MRERLKIKIPKSCASYYFQVEDVCSLSSQKKIHTYLKIYFFTIQLPEGPENQFYFKILFPSNLKVAYHNCANENIDLQLFILCSLFSTFLSLFKLILYHRTPYIWFTKAIMVGHFKWVSTVLVSHVEDEFLYLNYLKLD